MFDTRRFSFKTFIADLPKPKQAPAKKDGKPGVKTGPSYEDNPWVYSPKGVNPGGKWEKVEGSDTYKIRQKDLTPREKADVDAKKQNPPPEPEEAPVNKQNKKKFEDRERFQVKAKEANDLVENYYGKTEFITLRLMDLMS